MRYESLSIFLAIRFCHFLHLTLCTPSLQASNLTAPTMSKSGQPIKYAPPTENPLIGHGAPSLADIMAGRKRKSGTKVTTRKLLTRGSSSHCACPSAPSSSAQASSLEGGNANLARKLLLASSLPEDLQATVLLHRHHHHRHKHLHWHHLLQREHPHRLHH
jgi:hypothetical protein